MVLRRKSLNTFTHTYIIRAKATKYAGYIFYDITEKLNFRISHALENLKNRIARVGSKIKPSV